VNLLFVGYIIKRKGVDTLVRALDILVKSRSMETLILHIVGDTERIRISSRASKNTARKQELKIISSSTEE